MKLYCHPASTTSRMVMLFAAEEGIALDQHVIDLFTGEHLKDPYAAINPNRLVPVLEDGDFRLTESSAILKYLADKVGSAAYPKDLQQRARINERMDWFNSNLYRDLGYGLVYPQIFPHHKRDDATQSGTLNWGCDHAKRWLTILDENFIGPRGSYVCGDRITLADYFGAPMISLGEIIGCNYAPYPNITRWMGNMKALKSWRKVNEVFDGLVTSLRGKSFQAV